MLCDLIGYYCATSSGYSFVCQQSECCDYYTDMHMHGNSSNITHTNFYYSIGSHPIHDTCLFNVALMPVNKQLSILAGFLISSLIT